MDETHPLLFAEPLSAHVLSDPLVLYRRKGLSRNTDGFVAQVAVESSAPVFLLLMPGTGWKRPSGLTGVFRCAQLLALFETAASKLPLDTLECFQILLSLWEVAIEELWAWFPSPGCD